MALEFLEGRTLREVLIEHKSFAWEDAVGVAVQITSALAAAHRQEPAIVHRDLKPENVMVMDDGSVKVMDFGIAKVLQALSKTTTHSVGTLQYMSPEQIDASGVDERTDLYCLGLVLYEMLSGRPPFESASPRELLNLQCTEPPPPLPEEVRQGLPRGVEQLVFELLEKSPDERPASAADVLHDLTPFAPATVSPPKAGTSKTRSQNLTSPMSIRRSLEHAPTEQPRETSDGEDSAAPVRKDTIALVEGASQPKEISWRAAVALIVGLSLLAGLITYIVRVNSGGAETVPQASVEKFGAR